MTLAYWLKVQGKKLEAQLGKKRVFRQPMRVADRPHNWTIFFGLTSPLVSIIALVISISALWVNERSMKVGQRAYVVIKNARADINIATDSWDNKPGLLLVSISHSFEVHNLGRTPATVTDVRDYYQLPDGWTDYRDYTFGDLSETVKRNTWRGYVAQGGAEPVKDTEGFIISPEAGQFLKDYIEFRKDPLKIKPSSAVNFPYVRMRVELKFLDVFNDSHTVTWDLRPDFEPNIEPSIPDTKRFLDSILRRWDREYWDRVQKRNRR